VSGPIHDRLRALLGPEGVEVDPRGLPRAVPESDDAMALVCESAQREGWRFRIEGQASWLPADAPADFAVSTRGLNRLVSLSPADLVATVQAGMPLDALRAALAEAGMWLALDPPGRPDRTIGSIIATATAGPLRHGSGPVRDHVLGCTVATGDGRLVAAGGRVVKNVAGYDLTKLQVGGFGGFGVITEVNLRLRAAPGIDVTLTTDGERDALTGVARLLVSTQTSVAALELLSPALAARPEWVLAARLLGTPDGVEAEIARIRRETAREWDRLAPERATTFWNLVARAPLSGTVGLRAGVVLDGLDEAIDLVEEHLGGEGILAAGGGSGAIRWVGETDATALRRLRRAAATREIPITLERAPWPLRSAVGHFGAYREGIGQVVGKLRDVFDPKGTISVALEGRDGD
jgi:FAD/FMN-containing dehydrogenase